MDTRRKEEICIKQLDIFFLRFSIVVQIIDMCFDYNIAIRYLLNGKITSYILTICFILIPSLITVLVNIRMQKQDNEKNPVATRDDRRKRLNLIKKSLFYTIAVPLKLVPVIYYWETLKNALSVHKCKKDGDDVGEKQYYSEMLRKYRNIVFLRMIECYLEAAPQQILQLTLILMSYKSDKEEINLEFHQAASIISSLVSMGWAMANYHHSIRLTQNNKLNIAIIEIILQFLWPFCITVARILSLSVIASIWPIYVIICCMIHWTTMTIGILTDSTGILEFCRIYNLSHIKPSTKERIYSVLFASIIGIVHIFVYLNIANNDAFFKYRCFYFLSFLENFISSFLWIITFPPAARDMYLYVLFIIYIVSILLGTVAMSTYYFCIMFYPKKLLSPNISSIPLVKINTEVQTEL